MRLGVKELSIWDGDNFEESNLNRQVFCTEETLGKNKATCTKEIANKINSTIKYNCYNHYFGESNNDYNSTLSCNLIILCADVTHNWKQYRKILRKTILHGIPVIEQFLTEKEIHVHLIDKNNILIYDLNTSM